MKKSLLITFFAGIAGAIAVLWGVSNGYSASNFLEWGKSFFERGLLFVENLGGAITGNDDPVQIAASIISSFEGFSPKVYTDAGHQAIGYGHDLVPGDGYTSDSEIDEATGFSDLMTDLNRAVECIHNAIDDEGQLSANQLAALYSLAYNIGCGAFSSSTMVKLINSGDLSGAAAQFSVWNHSGGVVNAVLTARRASERALFSV